MRTIGKVAAIIIAYHPDNDKLTRLVQALSNQGCDKIVVYKNSRLDDSLLTDCEFCDFIGNETNDGLGKAINFSFQYLTNFFGSEFAAFTFDQDTEVAEEFVKRMNHYRMNLKVDGRDISAIVPRVFDSRSDGYEYKLRHRACTEGYNLLAVALQSGMLIECQTWLNNKFNEDLFIEFVDTEWCYRLASNGKYLYLSQEARIYHEVSDEKPIKFLSMQLLKYSSLRRYYFYRNSFFMLRSKDVPVYAKFSILRAFISRFVSIFWFEGPKYKSIKMSCFGVFDGLRSRFGKYDG
jgi:rhamnosyltransferase